MSPEFTLSVHGIPYRAAAYSPTTGLTIEMDDHYGSSVTIFCGAGDLAKDLADAINCILEQYRASNAKISEAAE